MNKQIMYLDTAKEDVRPPPRDRIVSILRSNSLPAQSGRRSTLRIQCTCSSSTCDCTNIVPVKEKITTDIIQPPLVKNLPKKTNSLEVIRKRMSLKSESDLSEVYKTNGKRFTLALF